MKCKRLLFLLLLFTATALSEQSFGQADGMVIKGKVTGKDGLALASVSVIVKGKTNEGTLTDSEGNFTLRVKENSNAKWLYLIVVLFGLIHGTGFSYVLKAMLGNEEAK